jgi:hypothetical protein
MNFVEVRSDLGGARVGLEITGCRCIGSVSWKQLMSAKGGDSFKFGGGVQKDSKTCDLLSIQAPAYDTVSGYWESDGSWICMRDVANVVRRLLQRLSPQSAILTGRRNVLSERHGTSFAELLLAFGELGYETTWVRLNLSAIGIPQDSFRVGVVAQRRTPSDKLGPDGILARRLFSTVLASISGQANLGPDRGLATFVEERRPRVGLRVPAETEPFGSAGIAWGDHFRSSVLRLSKNVTAAPSLAHVLGIDTSESETPTLSVRFVSRRGIKGLQIKKDGCAHSVGPAISAWPLLAISTKDADAIKVPEAFYNWRSSASGYSIFRIIPERALLLFGMHADRLSQKLESTSLSISDQYKAIATTASPTLLLHLVEGLGWRYRNGDEKALGKHEIHQPV